MKRKFFNSTHRLKGFDYSSSRWYFVTICTHEKRCNLSRVEGPRVQHSQFGRIVEEEWQRTSERRRYVALGEHVVMPNHFHGLIGLSPLEDRTDPDSPERVLSEQPNGKKTLGSIVGAFKSAATKRINLLRSTPGAESWQIGFHDRVVRDVEEFEEITNYIAFNPLNWHLDKNNPDYESIADEVRDWKFEHGM